VTGIVNGTTNYVLTRMTEERCTFAEAVAEAQELGLRGADPDRRHRRLRRGEQGGDHRVDRVRRARRRGRRVTRRHRDVSADDILAAEELATS
jgi:hypothetical protein